MDVAVQATPFDEAVRELREAVAVYFETVRELPEQDRERLLNRRAPLSLRARFFSRALRALFWDDNAERAEFTCACPA